MKKYILAAGALVVIGLIAVVLLLLPLECWGDLKIEQRAAIGALIIGFLALVAGLITILAAVAEVKNIFPDQVIDVLRFRRDVDDEHGGKPSAFLLHFENPLSAAIINAYRIEVRLVHSSNNLSDSEWKIQPAIEPLIDARWRVGTPFGDTEQQVGIALVRGLGTPKEGSWLRSGFRTTAGRLAWDINDDIPWYPDMRLLGPAEVVIIENNPDHYRWIVRWWSDRQTSTVDVIPLDPDG